MGGLGGIVFCIALVKRMFGGGLCTVYMYSVLANNIVCSDLLRQSSVSLYIAYRLSFAFAHLLSAIAIT
jgi:hypothetical protein